MAALLVTALLVVVPASEVAVSLVNLDMCRFLRPRTLPKLLLDDGIPAGVLAGPA